MRFCLIFNTLIRVIVVSIRNDFGLVATGMSYSDSFFEQLYLSF